MSSPYIRESRDLHVDALRGFALGGILLVNVMSFSSGMTGPSLGELNLLSPSADHVVVLLVAALAEFKFYPIFAFLFGYGFLLFWRRARWRGADASQLYNRRLCFLAITGIVHGIFIWFGDILSRYAVVALFLKQYLRLGPKGLLRAIRKWLLGAVILAVLFTLIALLDKPAPGNLLPPSIYPTGGYLEVTRQRLEDYLLITAYFMILLPQVMVIFLLGALTARMGWLSRPERHLNFWKRVLCFGLVIGLPANALWAWMQWRHSTFLDQSIFTWMALLDLVLPFQSAAMIAAMALTLHRPAMQLLVQVLAPAGRMPLTNYLAQSVVCSFFLYGYGLGLGDDLTQSGLAALAVGIYCTQLVASQWWLSKHDMGPMESWWRRVTYAPVASQPGPNGPG